MSRGGFEFDVSDILARLDRAQRDAIDDAAKQLRRFALNVTRKARAKAPVDTGRLRNSITAGTEADLANAATGGAPDVPHRLPEDSRGPYVDIGTAVEYAAAQEFGTSRGVPAHPFMRPALEEATAEFGRE